MIAYDVVDALRNNNRPAPDTGLATMHAFLDPEASIGEDEHEVGLRSLEEFIEDPPDLLDAFLNAGRVEHTPTEYSRTSGRVYHKVTLHPRRPIAGAAPAHPEAPSSVFYIELRQPDLGPREGCWLIRSILTEAQRQALDPPAPPRLKARPATNGAAPDSS